jgi:hypothetical protein
MHLKSAIVNIENPNFGDGFDNGSQFVHMLSAVTIYGNVAHRNLPSLLDEVDLPEISSRLSQSAND